MKLLDTQHKRKSMIITVTTHVIILLLLFFFGLKYLDPPLQSGIAINFGTSDEGMGNVQPAEKIESAPKPTAVPPSQPQSEIKDEVVTQDVEDAPVIEKEKKKAETPPAKLPEKKPDPKPDQSTTDALSSIIHGPKSDGKKQEGDGDDGKAGDKGSPDGDPNSRSYYGTGKGLDGDGNYQLGGRRALNKEKIMQNCNEEGEVVVAIEVDRSGRVIKAEPGVRGSTNLAACLLEPARKSALATRFNPDENAPVKQVGKIIYRFSLRE